jgi:uncharacterized protein YndB with AHSA1/START domain
MAAIIVEQIINAPSEKIWRAITLKEEMKLWYFDLKEFKAEAGFKFSFEGGTEAKTYLHLCEVKEVVPNRKLSYSWAYEGIPVETLVTFELLPEGPGKTKVKLTHAGVENFPADNPDMARGNFVEGWTHIIQKALKEYAEA